MESYSLADAKARLSELIDKVEAGDSVEITRRGKTVARVVPPEPPREAMDWEELKRFTDSQPMQVQSAGEFVRWMRDTDRY